MSARTIPPAGLLALALAAPEEAHAVDLANQVFLGASLVVDFGDGVHPGFALQLSDEVIAGYDPGVVSGAFLEGRWVAKRGASLDVGARFGFGVGERFGCGGSWAPIGAVTLDAAARLRRGGPGLRLGATGAGGYVGAASVSAFTRGDGWMDPSVTLGVRGFLPAMCVIGRPLRHGEGRVTVEATGPTAPDARRWLARGRDEHEAAGAFARLAAELRALGAPGRLIADAERAAGEEIGHAVASYALAAALGRGRVVAGPLRIPARALGRRDDAIARLAAEGLVDGVVNEGAMADAAEAAAHRGTPRERAIEEKIAVEERGHAAIGDRTIGWALREAPTATRRALRAVAAAAPAR